MANFKRSKVNTSGTSLQKYLDGITDYDVKRAFGDPNDDGYWDDEKGYDGREYTFTDDAGNIATLYARWGAWRVGAHEPRVAREFKEYFLGLIGKVAQ